MQGATIPDRTNLVLATVLALVQVGIVAIVPLALLPRSPWWGLLVLAGIATTPTHWALIHEGIHRHLHPDRRVNDLVSRGLAVLFGAPLRLLRTGHLGHHQLNGAVCERPELMAGVTGTAAARAGFYARLLGGVHLFEIAGNALAFLPSRWRVAVVRRIFYDGHADAPGAADAAVRALTGRRALRELRRDGALALGVLGFAAWAYGGAWPWLAAGLLGRAVLVSLLDNAFHYGAPLGDPHSGHNFALPGWIAPAMLHFHLHRVHHRHPDLPWSALPQALVQDGDRLDGGFAAGIARQFRGPVHPSRLGA
ncbi:MAG TPA: fatty acid desaturase [Azospirillaceae bacterium]|nr:fatty acid desaturase [Azospirillaceae bacterium]